MRRCGGRAPVAEGCRGGPGRCGPRIATGGDVFTAPSDHSTPECRDRAPYVGARCVGAGSPSQVARGGRETGSGGKASCRIRGESTPVRSRADADQRAPGGVGDVAGRKPAPQSGRVSSKCGASARWRRRSLKRARRGTAAAAGPGPQRAADGAGSRARTGAGKSRG